ncbi:PAB-dependent poly(A)-specific ribonuclease subunit 3 [Tulasnella sp. 419]|nr:PAB-dependent poly(A)-specific ribonuclease subunit 3 [Tulasnella sp. 418]KAG8961051.1 PAB-dependent poly(A)-specific ribonuclease subunit 3 [Tulasnella sp. 419]
MSRAIPIVAPSAAGSGTVSASSPGTNGRSTPVKKGDSTSQKQCRNILIYGSCKNEGKSCQYYHPPRQDSTTSSSNSPSTSPVLQTTGAAGGTLSVNVNAAPFVPRGSLLPAFVPKSSSTPVPLTEEPFSAPQTGSSVDDVPPAQFPNTISLDDQQLADVFSDMSMSEYNTQLDQSFTSHAGMEHDLYGLSHPQHMMMPSDAYYSASAYPPQPLNYHLYTSLPHVGSIPASQRIFMSDTLREDLQRRSEAIYATPPLTGLGLPESLHQYHSLLPLESPNAMDKRKWFGGWSSTVYKAVSKDDGRAFCLRRVEGFRTVNQAAFTAIDGWTKFRHPNIVAVIEAFTTKEFGDHSLVVAYDYHPDAQTLHAFHFGKQAASGSSYTPLSSSVTGSPTHHRGGGRSNNHNQTNMQAHIPERVIWTYVVQIANAIKAVHDAGMAVRTIDATRILVTGTNRVRINGCGILDVVAYNPTVTVDLLQQEDLVAFGKLVFALCCNNPSAMSNLPKAMDTISRHYSPDLKNVALFLVSKPRQEKVIDVLMEMFGTRLLTEMNAMQTYTDELENQLMGELENARLVRLLCKFGFINERPEFNHEPRWSETGDRYIIKLFRDYVFHQVDEVGNPVVNMSHVLTCLNKLDVGADERIMLISRDEQSCLVVSYKEVKACIEQAYGELVRGVR